MKNNDYDLLVVEDEPVVLSAIRKILEPEGFRMDEALNGDIALSKLKRQAYKLIVTDLMLPRISGLDLVHAIKQVHPCIPLIVITGYATLEKALQSFKVGSFDFIPKPFDTETFLAVISRGMNYSREMETRGPEEHAFLPIEGPLGTDDSSDIVYCLGCHSQAKVQPDGSAYIRVGETFSNMMGRLSKIEVVASDDETIQGKCCAHFITEDGLVNLFWAPLSGKIEAYNEDLDKNIRLIDTDPFDQGWIFRITPSNIEKELKHLRRCKRGETGDQ
jgi:CheY-like chemotaxis protein/glycine cleavage system H lipoate-binding protein